MSDPVDSRKTKKNQAILEQAPPSSTMDVEEANNNTNNNNRSSKGETRTVESDDDFDDDDDDANLTKSSFTSTMATEKPQSSEESLEFAAEENRQLQRWKAILTLVLSVTALAICAGTYVFVTGKSNSDYQLSVSTTREKKKKKILICISLYLSLSALVSRYLAPEQSFMFGHSQRFVPCHYTTIHSLLCLPTPWKLSWDITRRISKPVCAISGTR